jgi:hypothetical protein
MQHFHPIKLDWDGKKGAADFFPALLQNVFSIARRFTTMLAVRIVFLKRVNFI